MDGNGNVPPVPSVNKPDSALQEELDKICSETPPSGVFAKEWDHDIRRMLKYCRDKGIGVSTGIQKFCEPDPAGVSILQKKMDLHAHLCGLITPATPRSLAATDLLRKGACLDRRTLMTWMLLIVMSLGASVGLVGYVLLSLETPSETGQEPNLPKNGVANNLSPAGKGEKTGSKTPEDTNKGTPNKVVDTSKSGSKKSDGGGQNAQDGKGVTTVVARSMQLSWVFAALLGSSICGLFTMQHYVRTRSFDPDYVCAYLIRGATGVVAGFVLATFGSVLFKGDGTIAELRPAAIALLGGYSAEAVRQILDRLVEVMVTVVKGKDASAVRLAVAKELLSIPNKPVQSGEAQKPVQDAVNTIVKNATT